MKFGSTTTALTALPYLILNACAEAPSACAIYTSTKTDKDFLNQKPRN